MRKIIIRKGLVIGTLIMLFLMVFVILPINVSAAGPYFVKVGGNDSNAGTSWDTAFATSLPAYR